MLISMWFQSQIHPSFDTYKLLILKLQNDTLQTCEWHQSLCPAFYLFCCVRLLAIIKLINL